MQDFLFADHSSYINTAKEMGLTSEEAQLAMNKLGRRPNYVELGMIAAMWSEHCSYKSSRLLLKNLPTEGKHVLQGPGENAGIVDFGDGLALCFKIESHNHPSFIEPYQGAATGVGGILRDIFTMGARPVAFMNSLRFGQPEDARSRYLVKGVVQGIGGYGNCVGIPTVGGEAYFDTAYQGNILVNAFCVGVVDREKIFLARAQGEGNLVVYLGSKTGRDGIHGATMASDSLSSEAEQRRPTVQVGDPFTGKLLMEATLAMMAEGLIVGIQDMGAAGLTCSIAEMSSKGKCGMEVDLALVPCREKQMGPHEILLSESQERMLLVCRPDDRQAVFDIAKKWGVDAAVIGQVTATPRLRLKFHGEAVVDLPPEILNEAAPVYRRPTQQPGQRAEYAEKTAEHSVGKDAGELLVALLRSPNLGCRRWIYQQYDHSIGTDVVFGPGGDAALLRLKGSSLGLAMSCNGNGSYCAADPYKGAMIAVCESARNLACVGATPLGLSNCLNFGNPEHPEIMWQFERTIAGMRTACERLDIPVISGNVSFYNENNTTDIPPTPVIAMCGRVERVCRDVTANFCQSGDDIYLLGATLPSGCLQGEIARLLFPERGWPPCPDIDVGLELSVHQVVRELVASGYIHTAHDCAEGGLAVALAECCCSTTGIGAKVKLSSDFTALDLFTEEQSRVIIAAAKQHAVKIQAVAEKHGCPLQQIGTTGGERLEIAGLLSLPVVEVQNARNDFFSTCFRN